MDFEKENRVLTPIFVVTDVIRQIYVNVEYLRIMGINVYNKKKYIDVWVSTYRPGILIGKGGEKINELEKELSEMFGVKTNIRIKEIK